MTTLNFFAIGDPKPQPRARAVIRGNHAGVYNPNIADGWKQIVRLAARKQWDRVPFSGPLHVTMEFLFVRPQKHFYRSNGKIHPDAPIHHVGVPDADNLAKAVMDALTRENVWVDDCLVVHLDVWKRYATPPEVPGVSVTIHRVT